MPEQTNGGETENEQSERIAELRDKEPLTRLFRKSNAKILLAMLDAPRDMSAQSIAESAGIDRSTWYEQRDDLLDLGVIEETRTEGRSTLYDVADTETAEAVVDLRSALRRAA